MSDVMFLAVAAGAGAGAAVDIRTRRIPNAISGGLAALGLVLAATGASGVTIGSSMLGFLGGLLVMAPGKVLGATGTGDLKLMAGVGAVIGVERILTAFICTAIAGGVLALAIAIRRGRLGATLGGTGRMLRAPATGREIRSAGAHNRFSYGPAIAAGGMLAAWLAR